MKYAMLMAHHQDYGEGWSMSIGFRDELLSRGHDVKVYNLYENNGKFREDKQPRLYSDSAVVKLKTDDFEPDVIFLLDYGMFYSPMLCKENFPESLLIFEFGDTPQALFNHSPKFHQSHIVLTPDYPTVEKLRREGMEAHWSTHCADTRIYRPYDDVEPSVLVATTCGPRRHGKLKDITKPLAKIFGDDFLNDRFYHGEEHGRFLNRGHIVFQKSQFGEVTRRVFEGAACGKMVLTDRLSPATRMEELLVDGEDVVYYDSVADAADKIRYYADHPEEREKIASSGMQKVWEHHSVMARVDDLEHIIEEHIMGGTL